MKDFHPAGKNKTKQLFPVLDVKLSRQHSPKSPGAKSVSRGLTDGDENGPFSSKF